MTAKYLIVNADDYGYYSCVSEGILKGANKGTITATGIMANSPNFEKHLDRLKQHNELDKGVHLNISYGRPLSDELRGYLTQWQNTFPNKVGIVKAILSGKIPVSAIECEWRLQIERCVSNGIEITFLNSHEHLHMLPPLNKIFLSLVNEYGLIYSRYSAPEWQFPITPGSLFRNTALWLMNSINGRSPVLIPPKLIGMNESGKLNINCVRKLFMKLKPGNIYELMCHPGYIDHNEISNPSLLKYHDWEGELKLLLSDEFKKTCKAEGIELINYRRLAELRLN